jgi:hypothetical protein
MTICRHAQGALVFLFELEHDAFRADNGELGWTRAQIPLVVNLLSSQQFGIFGGELWWVRDGIKGWSGLVPQRHGPPAVYTWETKRRIGEPWEDFVERGASDAIAAVERWPGPEDLPHDLPGRILYNLTYASGFEDQILGSV